MLKQLQRKFVVINMTFICLMLIVIFTLVYGSTKKNLESESINMMRAIATNPFQPGRPNNPTSDLKLPFFTLQIGNDGKLLSSSGGYYDLSDEDFLEELIEESEKDNRETGIIEDHSLRYCRVNTPMGTVLVFSDMSSEKTTLNNLLKSFALIGLISFFAFLGISILLAKRAIKPVAKAWDQQKQFIADASHELKTPLTVIMTNTELLQADDYTEKERHNFLLGISMMSQQMRHLVEKMLSLAKSDAQEAPIIMVPFDFSELVLDTAISFEGVFVEKDLLLESHIESNISVTGHQESLKQVVDILLDNAQKYSFENSTTRITLDSVDRKHCRLSISNPGNMISQEELKSIFQRFYRADKARKRDGSFGLGLSIAENIVLKHKGKIWAESKNGINTFYVELRKK